MKPSSVPTWLSEEKERQQNSGHEGIDSSTNNGNNTDEEAEVKSTSKYCYCIGNQGKCGYIIEKYEPKI